MASLSAISLPHGSIPTQMFGNVNLQNAVMYVNENFAALKEGVNGAISSANESLDAKADADHDHDSSYAALEHTHGIDAITGLNAALDDKAALNHEHSQYLTQLPAHNHDVAGIHGLQSALDARAEKVHAHDITDVNGLDSRLGTMASAAYVDQQISQLGSSIKPIADEEVERHGADIGTQSSLGTVPADIIGKPESESIRQKNARIGTSKEYARADHVHVFDGGASTYAPNRVLRTDGDGKIAEMSALTPSKWMKTDVGGMPSTTDDDPATLGDSTPSDVGTSASAGTSDKAARVDHIHKIDMTVGSASSCGSFPNTCVTKQQTGVLWQAGGNSGAKIVMLFKGGSDGLAGFDLHACTLTISKTGIITKIEAVGENDGINVLGNY